MQRYLTRFPTWISCAGLQHSIRTLSCIILGLLVTSCTTTTDLWEATDPHAFVLVPRANITEAELQARNLRYYADTKRGDVWYVEKSLLRKTRDYTYRALGTPVTVVIDVVPPILLVGVVVLGVWQTGELPSAGGGSGQQQDQQWESLRRTMDDLRAEDRERSGAALNGDHKISADGL